MQDLQLLLSESSARVLELRLSGEVDMATVPPIRDAVNAAAGSGDFDTIVFDLSAVTFMDSSGLHVLAQARQAMSAVGGTVKVVCADGNLRKILELTGFDHLLAIFSERDEALAISA